MWVIVLVADSGCWASVGPSDTRWTIITSSPSRYSRVRSVVGIGRTELSSGTSTRLAPAGRHPPKPSNQRSLSCPVTSLTSQPVPVDSPLPAQQRQNKRRASSTSGSEIRNTVTKRPAATSSAPVRRSPRSHLTPIVAPTVIHDMEAPSHLAASSSSSHQNLRPQLSQAFRRLYGTAA